MKKLASTEKTNRGFEIVRFEDAYGIPCSLQASSLADYEQPGISAVWFGTDDARPMVMAVDAASVGVKTGETTGWVPYPIPGQVSLRTRAHLRRKQVEALVNHLQAWLETGSFSLKGRAQGEAMKKLSIDEAARRLCNEAQAHVVEETQQEWKKNAARERWRNVARLARELFAQPAAKKPKGKLFCICMDLDAFEQMRKHAAKAAAKKARR